jgi:hypothetical protein
MRDIERAANAQSLDEIASPPSRASAAASEELSAASDPAVVMALCGSRSAHCRDEPRSLGRPEARRPAR